MPEAREIQMLLPLAPLEVLTVAELWANATPELLSKLREDRRIERKPAGIHGRELAQYFSMWANTVDGGLIVIGMEDNGAVTGFASNGAYATKLERTARDCCPDAKVEVRLLNAPNVKANPDFLLLFRVHYHQTRVVKTTSNEAYIRYSDTKRKLSAEAIHELEMDKRQVDIEQEPCPTLEFPADFRVDLISDFVESVRDRNQYPAEYTAAEVLELRRLGKRRLVSCCSHAIR